MFFLCILSIAVYLTVCGVPYEIKRLHDGYQLIFDWTRGDVACHSGTYMSSKGFVESYQFPWDEGDVTVMSPDEAARAIEKYYCKLMGE